MSPQAFRHAGRKKGFALDTRSHPAAMFFNKKTGELRFATWGYPIPRKTFPRLKSSLLEEAAGVPREAWGGGHSPYSFCPH
jgi:hypothetical protein